MKEDVGSLIVAVLAIVIIVTSFIVDAAAFFGKVAIWNAVSPALREARK